MSIDCTCSIGTRSASWDDLYDPDIPAELLAAIKAMPVEDGLVDPFCPIHADGSDGAK